MARRTASWDSVRRLQCTARRAPTPVTTNDESYLDSFTHASAGYPSPDVEAIGARIVAAHFDHARDATVALRPGKVDDEMNGEGDGLADTAMGKPDVGR